MHVRIPAHKSRLYTTASDANDKVLSGKQALKRDPSAAIPACIYNYS